MKFNKDRLNAFYQVAIDRNFRKAAENLCLTQSALSQRVIKLEEEIGTALLVRHNDGIKITHAGSLLLDYACNLINMETETLNLIAGYHNNKCHGSLRIATYSSILRSVVMPSLAPIIRELPETYIEFCSRELRDLTPMLKNGEVDFIILDYFLEDPRLERVKIGEEKIVHIQNIENTVNNATFLDHDSNDMTTYDFFKQQGISNTGFKRCFFNDIFGIIDGVLLGLGQAIVSKHLIDGLDNLKIVPYSRELSNPVVLYYHKNRYLTDLHKKIIFALENNASTFLTQTENV